MYKINSKQHVRRHTYMYSGYTCTAYSSCEDTQSEMLTLLRCRITADFNTCVQTVYETLNNFNYIFIYSYFKVINAGHNVSNYT
jgi:hypothetical protein